MIQLLVCLLFEKDYITGKSNTAVPGLMGVYGEAWINVDPVNIQEVDYEDLFKEPGSMLRDYGQLSWETISMIEVWLNEGGLPVGIPLCTVMGLPSHIYLIDIRENDTEEEEE